MRTPRVRWRIGSPNRSAPRTDLAEDSAGGNRGLARRVLTGMGTTSVDPTALWLAAQRLDEAADVLQGALSGHLIDSAALDRLLGDVRLWQQAARETASALRTAAGRYTHAEAASAAVLR